MKPGPKSDDPRGSRAQSHASNPTSVEAYRALLTHRLRAEGAVGADASEHAELVFNLSRLHARISQDFEVLHRRRGWTWAGFRIMNVLWVFGTVEQRDVARLSGGSRAAISSALNTLERDGLVDRARDSHDRRLVRLEFDRARTDGITRCDPRTGRPRAAVALGPGRVRTALAQPPFGHRRGSADPITKWRLSKT